MLNIKRNKFFYSFQFRILLIAVFLVSAVILTYLIFDSNDGEDSIPSNTENTEKFDSLKIIQGKIHTVTQLLDNNIDSILFSFGIKKEWITTNNAGSKPIKSKNEQLKKASVNVQWFQKNVLIPKDLTTAEVNLDLSNLIKSTGLFLNVNEDIKTTDIEMNIYKDSSSAAGIPLAKVIINHTEKINRESGSIVVILSNINELKENQINEILNNTNEFSFILSRNLEDIDFQNKLIHLKKDIIINLIIGEKETVESDFWIDMEEKEIKQKVKSLNIDFPSIKYVLLSTSETGIHLNKLYRLLDEEFAKFEIKTIADTAFFKFPDVDLSSSKVLSVINTLKARAGGTGKVITVLSMDYDTFKSFYNEALNLKKQGFKFYSYSQFLNKETDKQKREKLLRDKQEEDAKKKKNVKPLIKLKETKTPAKTKTDSKKTLPTKRTEKKK